jgi:exodeoxyribonuclease VII large subunit
VAEQRALVAQLRSRMTTRLTQRLSHDIAQLEQLRSRPVLRAPESMIDSRTQQLWMHTSRGREVIERRLSQEARATAELRATLRALSPAATLARGYAIAHLPAGDIVRDAEQAPAGSTVLVRVGRGSFSARSDGPVDEGDGETARTDAAEREPRMEA